MDVRTTEFLTRADANRAFAQDLLSAYQRHQSPAPPLEWVMVVAFYSAVHYINAYLWEMYKFEPRDHSDRTLSVQRDASLVQISGRYDMLRNWAHYARYEPTFSATLGFVQQAMANVREIRNKVDRELRASP